MCGSKAFIDLLSCGSYLFCPICHPLLGRLAKTLLDVLVHVRVGPCVLVGLQRDVGWKKPAMITFCFDIISYDDFDVYDDSDVYDDFDGSAAILFTCHSRSFYRR